MTDHTARDGIQPTHSTSRPTEIVGGFTPVELRKRLPIDLVIFDLLDTLKELVNVEIRDDLDQAGMPTIVAMIDLLQEVLDQSPAIALQRLQELAEPVQMYSWVFEHEGHLTAALKLKERWFEIDALLRSIYPNEAREPWETLQHARKTRFVVR